MARMPGRFTYGPCHCRDCGGGHNDTRRHKRIEARQWPVTEGLWPLPLLPAPLTDESDCRHGCNGDCVVLGYASESCDWQCHPGVELDPARAARFDAKLAEMEARQC